ncbi:hypothetical protein MRX96_019013 [Rhipicephalus microplus]
MPLDPQTTANPDEAVGASPQEACPATDEHEPAAVPTPLALRMQPGQISEWYAWYALLVAWKEAEAVCAVVAHALWQRPR